jgi:hypothetical protein
MSSVTRLRNDREWARFKLPPFLSLSHPFYRFASRAGWQFEGGVVYGWIKDQTLFWGILDPSNSMRDSQHSSVPSVQAALRELKNWAKKRGARLSSGPHVGPFPWSSFEERSIFPFEERSAGREKLFFRFTLNDLRPNDRVQAQIERLKNKNYLTFVPLKPNQHKKLLPPILQEYFDYLPTQYWNRYLKHSLVLVRREVPIGLLLVEDLGCFDFEKKICFQWLKIETAYLTLGLASSFIEPTIGLWKKFGIKSAMTVPIYSNQNSILGFFSEFGITPHETQKLIEGNIA